MVLLESKSLSLGQVMPDFSLADPSGKAYSRDDVSGDRGLLVVFTCNHCPYAIAIWERLIQLSVWAKENGVHTVAINSNINPDYPDDSPEMMAKKITEWGIPFPYLVDHTQEIAKAYHAQCTPDLYLLNGSHELVYHGRLDDNWKQPELVTREELKEAISCLVNDEPVSSEQFPSMGCSIKWLS